MPISPSEYVGRIDAVETVAHSETTANRTSRLLIDHCGEGTP